MRKLLNVFYATGKEFVKYFTVSITSLMENNKNLQLNVYVIYDFIETKELNKTVAFAKQEYNIEINLLFIDSSLFKDYKTNSHVPSVTYFRLLLADIIPHHIDTGLFIDSDTIVTGSLNDLADIKFSNLEEKEVNTVSKFLYAVSEIEVEREINSKKITELGYPTIKHFNAGVLLVSLKNWRLTDTSQKLIAVAKKYMNALTYMDQYVLNIYFVNKWGELDPTFNALHLIRKLHQTPLIIHYAGASKPWNYMNNHPYKYLYFKYLKLSPYRKTKKYVDFSLSNLFRKHIYETKSYINFYRSGEYRRIKN